VQGAATSYLLDVVNGLRAGLQHIGLIWMRSHTGAPQTVGLRVYDGGAYLASATCTVTTAWQRFAFPFTVSATGGVINNFGLFDNVGRSIDVEIWGAQVTQFQHNMPDHVIYTAGPMPEYIATNGVPANSSGAPRSLNTSRGIKTGRVLL
jgi:hypothetical protein